MLKHNIQYMTIHDSTSRQSGGLEIAIERLKKKKLFLSMRCVGAKENIFELEQIPAQDDNMSIHLHNHSHIRGGLLDYKAPPQQTD